MYNKNFIHPENGSQGSKTAAAAPAAESIRESGGKSDPEKYHSILVRAIAIVAEMCRLLSKQGRETLAEAWGKALTKLMDMATEQLAGRRIDIKKDTRHRSMER